MVAKVTAQKEKFRSFQAYLFFPLKLFHLNLICLLNLRVCLHIFFQQNNFQKSAIYMLFCYSVLFKMLYASDLTYDGLGPGSGGGGGQARRQKF